jgi:hypothetical protein
MYFSLTMVWKRRIALLVVLALVISTLALVRLHYVRSGAVGDLIWNSDEAYVFLSVYQYGNTFSCLGVVGEMVKEGFPFGASPPKNKHYYATVLHITPGSVEHFTVDNFRIGSPAFPVGQNVYAGNLLAETGPMKWYGSHFQVTTPEEKEEVRKALQLIPPGPNYDNVGGWSKRAIDLVSPGKGDQITIQIAGKPITFTIQSGFTSSEAFIDLTRSAQAPERIWQLDEKTKRVSLDTYKQIFGR